MVKKKSKTKTSSSTYGNYSKLVQTKLKSLKAIPGDRISIIHDIKEVEGHLLTQNELGDPNTILIKLDNGYNIGISVDKTTEITKLSGSVALETFQVRIPKQNMNLPEISLLATGGTIASRIDYQTGGVVMAMQPEEIFASLPELFDQVSFKEVKSLFNLGSEDMDSKHWASLAVHVSSTLNDGSRGVVISHGTDTMGYTSAALSFMVQNLQGPVVITGAQRSSDRGSFDGAINLISASRVAANSDIATVMVCMHESSNDDRCLLSRGTKVRKMHTSRRDAFRSINDLPLGTIDIEGKIIESSEFIPRRHEGSNNLLSDYEDKTSLIKIYPGIAKEILDWHVDQGYRGIIIEGTGLGHVPTFTDNLSKSWISSIDRAIEEGIYVGMTSQCLYGRVHPFVYKALRTTYQSGVNYLQDMLPETALIKLGWALGNYSEDNEVKDIMKLNLAGEYSSQLHFKEFLN